MRLFAGLDVPYQMRRNLELLLHLLKPTAAIQWSPLDNLHITTKFIGEWPDERLDELKAALATLPRPGAFDIGIRSLGWFPTPHHPRILFAGISAPPALGELARDSEAACAGLGVAREDRDFKPHLTLARIKGAADLLKLKQTIAALPSVDFGAFRAAEHHLYLSRPGPAGSQYSKLASYPL